MDKVLFKGRLGNELLYFMKYSMRNRYLILFFCILAFVAYGFPLTHFTLSIDEENALFSNSITNDWVGQGRFGIVLIKWFFNYWYSNSITATFLGVLTLIISSLLWSYLLNIALFEKARNRSYEFVSFIVIFLFFSFPAYTENMGFSLMSFELGIGWIFTSVAVVLIFKSCIEKKHKEYLMIGSVLLSLAIAIYQSFLLVFVFAMVASMLIYLFSCRLYNEKINLHRVLLYFLNFSLIVIISLVVYKFVDSILGIFIPSSQYISTFFAWKNGEVYSLTMNLLGDFKNIFLGRKIYGSMMIPLSYIAGGVLVFIQCYRLISDSNNRKDNAVILFLIGLILIIPLIMPITLGTPLPIRVNLTWSLSISFIWFLCYLYLKNRIVKLILILFLCWGAFYQSLAISQLFYGDYNRYEADRSLAQQINYRISVLDVCGSNSCPVVYVGEHEQTSQPNIIKQEVLGYSFFEWDGGNPNRIRNFMSSLGFEYAEPTEEQTKIGERISNTMPVWPNPNSVVLKDGIIVVKLSEDPLNYKLNVKNSVENTEDSQKFYKLNFSDLIFQNGLAEVAETEKGLIISAGDDDPQVSFSFKSIPVKDSFKYIRIMLNSENEGNLQLFLAEEEGIYSEQFSGSVELEEGRNIFYVEKNQLMRKVESLRIDPPDNSSIILESIKLY